MCSININTYICIHLYIHNTMLLRRLSLFFLMMYIHTYVYWQHTHTREWIICCNRFYVCFARFNLEIYSPYKLSMYWRIALLLLLLFRTCCAPHRIARQWAGVPNTIFGNVYNINACVHTYVVSIHIHTYVFICMCDLLLFWCVLVIVFKILCRKHKTTLRRNCVAKN